MSDTKKPSLGVYIDANGKVFSEPKEVMDMLKWVVKTSEDSRQKKEQDSSLSNDH